MTDKEQAKPLAPALPFYHPSDHRDDESSTQFTPRQHKCVACCGCFAAVFLILAVTILTLVFTVFNVKPPIIKMDKVIVQPLYLVNATVPADANITVVTVVSVKNPNAASFRYSNGTTTIYYRGVMVGDARIPPGKAGARRTIHLNVTADVIPGKLSAVPGFVSDVSSLVLRNLTANTVIDGKVKILNVVKKHLVVKLCCTMSYNISSQAIVQEEYHCGPHHSF